MGKRTLTTFRLTTVLIYAVISTFVFTPTRALASGTCGTGTWTSGNLEIHHIDIGQGDSALIVGPTGKSLLLDVGETNWNSSANAKVIGPYIESVLGCTSLDYVLISHFHLDHIGYVGYGGLWYLVETQGFSVGTTLVRDYNTYLGDTSGTFTNWKTYLEGAGQATLHPVTALEGAGQVDLGPGVTFNIVALDGNGSLLAGDFRGDSHPPSENDYSIGAVLSYGDFDEWLGGDLDGQYEVGFGYTYHDIELSVAPEAGDVDVYKANHHGSSHSSSATFINQLDPEVSVVSEGDGNTYGHPTQQTIDRLLATSTVYLTERGELTTDIGAAIVAGNIVIKTSDGLTYTVNGTEYAATEPVRTDTDGDGYFAEADPDDGDAGLLPAPNGGCGLVYQTCSVSCQLGPGQVLINEVLPAPSGGTEWVELYNNTSGTLNIGYCYVDDIPAGSAAYQIPASTLLPAHAFWTLDRTSYFNNTGDDVRLLKEDASTVLDTFTYGTTGSDLAWYRLPDGGPWAASATASTTKGLSNTLAFYPIVSSITRADPDFTDEASVDFTVTFSKPVTGVNTADFKLTTTDVTSPSISGVSGAGAVYTVTVATGYGDGTLRLDVADDDSIRDASNHALGGAGAGNGNYAGGEFYTVLKPFVAFTSQDVNDGWILETAEISNKGGKLNSAATMLRIGDDAANRQYRSLLSFDTPVLPDGVTITSVRLRLKYAGLAGTNPFATHGKLLADICKGAYRNDPVLQPGDFNAICGKNKVLLFNKTKVNNWYWQPLNPLDFPFLNLGGITQFRLRFAKDDNNDFGADFLKLWSGNAISEDRPQLIVEYGF